jgi:hypothetical protein
VLLVLVSTASALKQLQPARATLNEYYVQTDGMLGITHFQRLQFAFVVAQALAIVPQLLGKPDIRMVPPAGTWFIQRVLPTRAIDVFHLLKKPSRSFGVKNASSVAVANSENQPDHSTDHRRRFRTFVEHASVLKQCHALSILATPNHQPPFFDSTRR